MPGERWARERMGLALNAYNEFMLAVARSLRFVREKLGLEGLRPRFDEGSSDRRVFLIEVELPASAPLVIAVYSTTEEARPLTWSRVEAKLRRLRRYAAQRAPPARDTFVAVVTASPRARATGPAQKRARRSKVALGTVKDALKALRGYLVKRLRGLIKSLREKEAKAYGELAELLRVLYLLASRLGPVGIPLHEVEAMIRARRA
ncbi:hypothetical protein Pyrde_0700 [Pyrodictium delaneyi]|uniref:Uncharacterized protein n=1 Tax=Pyrodictium delaneyi TaxID=1273541 RepID=A0A0P0N2C6_9CREN|nr:hypothetical protein [Pyrodictium delaneyi]ALL00750.1 hypothetical protein Pyrde_0700 [Pyrodictium delaneyi]